MAGAALRGNVQGGNQPVVGAHVYLMAATVSGVGPAGYGLASTSLLNSSVPALCGINNSSTCKDANNNYYVVTASDGTFLLDTISVGPVTTYDYTCPTATTQVYLYVVGGDPGAGTNADASFMAALGSCGALNSSTFIQINELTTVAAAYALAGFATDALHVSIPQYASAAMQTALTTDALAQTNLQNAFATAGNLVNSTTGLALTTTPGGNGTVTTAQVITLADILGACINSNPSTSTICATLMNNAGSTGGATGTIPSETATAMINIAHHPYVSSTVMSNLYGLAGAIGAPFAGGDTSQPTDFTVSINFTGGGLFDAYGIAIDAAGSIWIANNNTATISKFANDGTPLSGTIGYTGGGLDNPYSIAIDPSGNAWVANESNNTVSEFTNNGTPISIPSGYTGGAEFAPISIAIDGSGNAWVGNIGISGHSFLTKFSSSGTATITAGGATLGEPFGLAIDASGNVWVANGRTNLSEFSSSGIQLSGSGYTGGGLTAPYSIAIDAAGNAWTANYNNSNTASLSEFSSAGTPISPSINYFTGYVGGGLFYPRSIAIDSSGNAWAANSVGGSISEFSSAGTPISPSPAAYASAGGVQNQDYGIAVDGSGNVWTANFRTNSLTELIGAASPVVTPLAANLTSPYTDPASLP